MTNKETLLKRDTGLTSTRHSTRMQSKYNATHATNTFTTQNMKDLSTTAIDTQITNGTTIKCTSPSQEGTKKATNTPPNDTFYQKQPTVNPSSATPVGNSSITTQQPIPLTTAAVTANSAATAYGEKISVETYPK